MSTKILPALSLAMMVAIAASAQDVSVSALPAEVPGPVVEPNATLSLDLETAYSMALARNLDLQVGRFGIATATASIFQQTGQFDPLLSASFRSNDARSPTSSDLEGAEVLANRSTTFGLGIAQALPTGTQVSLDASTYRAETNNTFVFLNPSWSSDLSLSLSQPLLRGFGTTVNRSGIVIARNLRQQDLAGFELQVMGTLRDVEYAYWDYVAARRAVAVAQQSLELATRLLNETKERVNVGTSAPIDIIQSESGVATRKQAVIAAKNTASNAEDNLKRALGFDRPDEWTASIKTTEDYFIKPVHPDLRQSIDTALEKRPDLEQAKLDLDRLQLNVDVARNSVLPSLNLTGSYGLAGIGGDLYGIDEPTQQKYLISRGGLGDSLTQIGKANYPKWAVGLTLSVPLGNNDAKAALAQRRWDLKKGEVGVRSQEQQIILQVRTAVRALEDGAAAIDAAAAAREFAERNLEAEQTKFANGLSTNYQVLQIQDDLAQAQLSEIRAWLDYRKAYVGYLNATATLLDNKGIEISDPGQPDIPHDYWKDVKWMQFTDLKSSMGEISLPPRPVSEEPAKAAEETTP